MVLVRPHENAKRWKYDGFPYRACVMLVGSPVMYDIILFENCRTRKREAGISEISVLGTIL